MTSKAGIAVVGLGLFAGVLALRGGSQSNSFEIPALSSFWADPEPVTALSVVSPVSTPVASYGSRLSRSEALGLVSRLDAAHFGGWFAANVPASDVVAIWKHESALKPGAINLNDPYGGAWGIGQVLADVARIDYGIPNAQSLLDPLIGGRVSMAHMKSTIERLSNALGYRAKFSEWAQAYNAGVAGYLSGVRVPTYLVSVNLARYV